MPKALTGFTVDNTKGERENRLYSALGLSSFPLQIER